MRAKAFLRALALAVSPSTIEDITVFFKRHPCELAARTGRFACSRKLTTLKQRGVTDPPGEPSCTISTPALEVRLEAPPFRQQTPGRKVQPGGPFFRIRLRKWDLTSSKLSPRAWATVAFSAPILSFFSLLPLSSLPTLLFYLFSFAFSPAADLGSRGLLSAHPSLSTPDFATPFPFFSLVCVFFLSFPRPRLCKKNICVAPSAPPPDWHVDSAASEVCARRDDSRNERCG